jgi:hypothetical protein
LEAIGKSATMPTANPSGINCIVTSGSLIPSLAKCLLYRLDDVVSSENGTCPILEHIFEHLFSVLYNILREMNLADSYVYNIHFVSYEAVI